jgi:hypothetical protein
MQIQFPDHMGTVSHLKDLFHKTENAQQSALVSLILRCNHLWRSLRGRRESRQTVGDRDLRRWHPGSRMAAARMEPDYC